MNGVKPITMFLIPMLGDKHPDQWPRFRDCFLQDDEHPEYDNHIQVYTRVGGGNRGGGYGEEELLKHPNFVATFDDDFDSTYGTYVFSVPDQWKADFELITNNKVKEISKDLQNQIIKVFPKLKEKLESYFSTPYDEA